MGSITKGEKKTGFKEGFQWKKGWKFWKTNKQQTNMLKEYHKRLYENQTKTKIKTAKLTLTNKQAQELDVSGSEDEKVSNKPDWDQDRVTGTLLVAVSAE